MFISVIVWHQALQSPNNYSVDLLYSLITIFSNLSLKCIQVCVIFCMLLCMYQSLLHLYVAISLASWQIFCLVVQTHGCITPLIVHVSCNRDLWMCWLSLNCKFCGYFNICFKALNISDFIDNVDTWLCNSWWSS